MSAFATNEGPVASAKLNQKTLFVGTGAAIAAATTYAGMLAFCTSTGSGFIANVLYERDAANATWNTVSPWSFKRVTADQTSSSSAYMSAGVSISLAPNTNYFFRATLFVTIAMSGSVRFEVHSIASGATVIAAFGGEAGQSDYPYGGAVTSSGTQFNGGDTFSGFGDIHVIEIRGMIMVGANAGTLQIDFCDYNNTGNVTVKAGSWLETAAVV